MKKRSTQLLHDVTVALCQHLPPIDAAKSSVEVAALIADLALNIVEQIEQIVEGAE